MEEFSRTQFPPSALDCFRRALREYAPEIPEGEITAGARFSDLRLDTVTLWAAAAEFERLAKTEIPDSAICSAHTVADLLRFFPGAPRADSARQQETGLSEAAKNLADFFNR